MPAMPEPRLQQRFRLQPILSPATALPIIAGAACPAVAPLQQRENSFRPRIAILGPATTLIVYVTPPSAHTGRCFAVFEDVLPGDAGIEIVRTWSCRALQTSRLLSGLAALPNLRFPCAIELLAVHILDVVTSYPAHRADNFAADKLDGSKSCDTQPAGCRHIGRYCRRREICCCCCPGA